MRLAQRATGHLHSPWLAGALDLHVAGGDSLREVHSCWVLFLQGEKKLTEKSVGHRDAVPDD